MTWEELINKARVWLGEAGSHSRLVQQATVRVVEDDSEPTPWETLCLLQELNMGLSDLHSACEELLTGLDALAIAMRGLVTEEEPEEARP